MFNAKDSQIFPTKTNSVFEIFMFKILTKGQLTTSLILNNYNFHNIYRDALF